MTDIKYPVILSFDVGVINLSYCLLTQQKYENIDGTSYTNWFILDWNNIDLTNRDEQKCICGAKASLVQTINNETNYYCKTHSKKIDTSTKTFDECFLKYDKKNIFDNDNIESTCQYEIGTQLKVCGKVGSFINNKICYCTTHAKQSYKTQVKLSELKPFKFKNSATLNFDDVKYGLIMELEKRTNLLSADYVVIENQPSFKNPRMKSIASTIYDYYLIRGIIDKPITKSQITKVKFMSPSNKLKIADEGDTNCLVKAKKTDDTKAYKLTKSLGIKYCLDLTKHLPEWVKHFNSFKKKDDLADSFLQGAYFYTNSIHGSKSDKIIQKTNILSISKTKTDIDLNIIDKNTFKLIDTGIVKKTNKKNKQPVDIEV